MPVSDGRVIRFQMRPFGVKTIRVLSAPAEAGLHIEGLTATAVSDMQIGLRWKLAGKSTDRISRYHVYRGTTADFKPTLLNLVARPPVTDYLDQPQLHTGGWITSRLEPETTYYYRIAAVDRMNNQGPVLAAVKSHTLKATEKNMCLCVSKG